MKLLPLYDLLREINRLFIAGSKFAKNDPRLQKQAAIFDKLGEKSPVFKKIAAGIEALVNAESVDSSIKLLEISALLYSILYTQGETVDAEQQETGTSATVVIPLTDVHTGKSYLELKPLIEALRLQKGGRLDTVKKSFENGQFDDFRIYPLLDEALADRYTELANYVETTVIPKIGKPIIPFVIKNFSYEGRPDDVRRFRILRRLGYPEIYAMVDEILTGKSVQLQAEAVKTLGNDPKNEELLIKFTGDRQKLIRLAAYEAIAELNTETALNALAELFISCNKKQDISELSEVLKIKLPDKFMSVLLEKAKADYEKCLESDKSSDTKTIIDAFETLMISINPLINNISEDILAFYRDMFIGEKYRELSKIAESKACKIPGRIVDSVAKSLENTEEGLECLMFLTENSCHDEFLYSCFRASVKNKTERETVYDYFSEYIDKLLDSDILAEVFIDSTGKPRSNDVDERWRNLFANKFLEKKNISFNVARVYIGLIDEKSEELQSFLYNVVKSYTTVNDSFNSFAELLINSGHPDAFELIFKIVSAMTMKIRLFGSLDAIFGKFPKEYAERFRKIGDKIVTNNFFDANTYYNIAQIIER
jgi:hypothetical protein